MRRRGWTWRERRRGRAAVKLGLLMLPTLFWSAVFMAIAGVGPLERAVERVPDAAQMVVALVCPLLALMLGLGALRQEETGGVAHDARSSRVAVAAGLALFVFAALCALRPA